MHLNFCWYSYFSLFGLGMVYQLYIIKRPIGSVLLMQLNVYCVYELYRLLIPERTNN